MSEHASKAVRHASPGWLIQRLSRRFEAEMEADLAPHGVTLGQFALLMASLEAEGLTQTDLGTIFAMPAWKISRHLDGLEASGLVIRQPDPASRRTHRIVPTEAARALAPALRGVGQAVNARLLAPLAPGDRDRLVALLQQVVVPGERF
ncbi:MarR family winged helix-turn-helix transcriptional regulator [Pararhodobacter zhoushanensis]|uniref:MarR family winged helix-turn-helix transcriptional regulator n=1 Tax=Pararhodobacter zhoushanensis TaxID=2479545 RepID=A0ABT3H298_9RHOB|nr:MarR family winged helix-turn-helix transcriptional regulator [Pararhodobacter zhoushanensis]MCW1933865.1 MarR family winged helix-turn-helix transcriptional regulator [Pararhodobacter zhoushanensis]